jgi:hypothetical protein
MRKVNATGKKQTLLDKDLRQGGRFKAENMPRQLAFPFAEHKIASCASNVGFFRATKRNLVRESQRYEGFSQRCIKVWA